MAIPATKHATVRASSAFLKFPSNERFIARSFPDYSSCVNLRTTMTALGNGAARNAVLCTTARALDNNHLRRSALLVSHCLRPRNLTITGRGSHRPCHRRNDTVILFVNGGIRRHPSFDHQLQVPFDHFCRRSLCRGNLGNRSGRTVGQKRGVASVRLHKLAPFNSANQKIGAKK